MKMFNSLAFIHKENLSWMIINIDWADVWRDDKIKANLIGIEPVYDVVDLNLLF